MFTITELFFRNNFSLQAVLPFMTNSQFMHKLLIFSSYVKTDFKDGRQAAMLFYPILPIFKLDLAPSEIYPHFKFHENPSRRFQVIDRTSLIEAVAMTTLFVNF